MSDAQHCLCKIQGESQHLAMRVAGPKQMQAVRQCPWGNVMGQNHSIPWWTRGFLQLGWCIAVCICHCHSAQALEAAWQNMTIERHRDVNRLCAKSLHFTLRALVKPEVVLSPSISRSMRLTAKHLGSLELSIFLLTSRAQKQPKSLPSWGASFSVADGCRYGVQQTHS